MSRSSRSRPTARIITRARSSGRDGIHDYTTVFLPDEIEHICPDYSLYGVREAYGFLTRGCVNRRPVVHRPRKGGCDTSGIAY